MQGRSFRQANICIDDFKRFKVNSTWRKSWERVGWRWLEEGTFNGGGGGEVIRAYTGTQRIN